MATNAVSAQDLSYRYKDLVAVDQMSFDLAEGEVLGFLGPNGAGKSTTVKMLTGQLRPVSGHVMLLGKDITQHTNQLQAHIGVSFETTNLYEQMSAVENLQLFARLFGVRNFDAIALLEKVGLSGRANERISNYSKGMKQRLMLARALVNSPRILFLDEPTDGLDPVSSQTVHNIIREAASNGTAVFLTTHDMVEADKLSDRVAFVNSGRIVALDKPSKLKQKYGNRAMRFEVELPDGSTAIREIMLDGEGTAQAVHDLLSNEKVITAHTEEATLEDIFVEITGRRLQG